MKHDRRGMIGWKAGFILAAILMAARMASGSEDENLAYWPLWRDPTFVRQFLGSYGMQAEVEPRVTVLEREELEKVATMMAMRGGQEKARAHLSQIVKPADTAVFDFTLGSICFQQDQLNAAAQWYKKAIAKFPSFLRAHKNLGIVSVRLGDYEAAVGSLTRAIELGVRDGVTLGLLGYACLMADQPTAAETAYRDAVLLQPDAMDWKLGLGRCLFKLRKFEEAAALCGELIARYPDRADLWVLQANAYLGMKETAKAAENFEYLEVVGKATAQSLNTLGDIYANDGYPDLAAESYEKAFGRDAEPDITRGLRNVDVLVSRGAYAEASRLIKLVKVLPPDKVSTAQRKRQLKLEARVAAVIGASNGEATRILEEIVELDPLDGEALILLGQRHAAAGELEKGIFLFERAAGMAAFEAEACLRHAQCLVRAGRYAPAVPLLKRTQELKPRDDVARYLEQVERVARTKL